MGIVFEYIVLFSFLISNVFALNLVPISSPKDITDAQSASKREESFIGDLDLQDFETFYWGAPAGKNLIYANLTVYFPEQYEAVIAMERFAGKLKSVQCAEDMMLEFTDDAAFEYAKDVWNWVNQDVNNSFIMVTNYEGCADDMERLPFVVSNIRYDEVANKAYLTADLKEWEEIAHSYTLNVGHMPLTPNHRMLMERGVIPRAADFTMDLTSGYDKNLFSTTVGGWTTSVDAVVRTVGSLNVDFDVDVEWLKLKSAAMTINPEDVAASIQLVLTEKGTLTKAYSWQNTIISIPIEGIQIAKVVKLGAFLDVDVGFTMEEWTGTATANLGARMEISNSATVKVDLVNSKNNKFSGWMPTFSPIPLTLNAKVEGSAKIFAEPNIKLEASALGKGWNVGLNLQMPYIQADFAAMFDSTGVCESKKTLGVDIDAKIGVELTAQAATKGNEANPFWSQELYSNEWDLFSKCLAFGPNNAKSGEVADPDPPASKTKKTKTTNATKTKTTKAPTTTKEVGTTEDLDATKAKPTSTNSSKKPTTTDAEPTKAATSRTKKPTDTDEPSSKTSVSPSATTKGTTGSSKSITIHGSSTDGETSRSAKSTTDDGSSSSAMADTADPTKKTTEDTTSTMRSTFSDNTITLSVSSSSSSTSFGWTNSSRTRSDPTHAPESNTEESPSTTGTSDLRSLGSDTQTLPASTTGNGAPASTPSGEATPTTFATASISPSEPFTSSSLLSSLNATATSSSPSTPSEDACSVDSKDEGCGHCKDNFDMDESTREYFAMEVDGLTTPSDNTTALLKRAKRIYKFTCDTLVRPVTMAEYPTYGSRIAEPNVVTVSDWYQGQDVTNCLNHKITTTSANPPTTSHTNPIFHMEHIYEGNWIVNFLTYLNTEEGLDCNDIADIFFEDAPTNNDGVNWAQALMESLGSTKNQDFLVFLKGNINGAKHRIFDEGNNVIEPTTFGQDTASAKMEKIAVVGRALDYLAQPLIGKKLKATAESVEATLNALVDAIAEVPELKEKLKHLGDDQVLAKTHRAWLNGFMSRRNEVVATTNMSQWASLASDAYEKETPSSPRETVDGKVVHSDKTLSFLQALQTAPPEGFNAEKWAPII